MTEEQALAKAILKDLDWTPLNPDTHVKGCDQDHLYRILTQILDGKVVGNKAHRFIGWAQGVMCMKGILSLEHARDLNREVINGGETKT